MDKSEYFVLVVKLTGKRLAFYRLDNVSFNTDAKGTPVVLDFNQAWCTKAYRQRQATLPINFHVIYSHARDNGVRLTTSTGRTWYSKGIALPKLLRAITAHLIRLYIGEIDSAYLTLVPERDLITFCENKVAYHGT